MSRALSRRALRAIFFKMKHKGPKPKAPTTLEDLAKAYKLPKVRIPQAKKPVPVPKVPTKLKRARRAPQPVPPIKQEIVIKVETPQAAKPKQSRPKSGKKQRNPKLEGAAKEAEKKTRREKFVEGAEAVGAGETYATAASGLFGFIKRRKKVIKAGAKRVGVAGAEGAVAGGAGTAVYAVATKEEKEKKKKRKKKAS